MMTDPIADMLTRMRNAASAKKSEVSVPFSKLKKAIADIFVQAGYLDKVQKTEGGYPQLVLTLKYDGGASAVQNIKRVSKPGHRHYVKAEEIKKVLGGFGLAIISTPKGLLTDAQARKAKVGGEVICEIF
jgi:small subunit ribosomal protein S8